MITYGTLNEIKKYPNNTYQYILSNINKDEKNNFIFKSNIKYEEGEHFLIYDNPVKIILQTEQEEFNAIFEKFMQINNQDNQFFTNITNYRVNCIFVFKNNKEKIIDVYENIDMYYLISNKYLFSKNCFSSEEIKKITQCGINEYICFVFNFLHCYPEFSYNIILFNKQVNWTCNKEIIEKLNNNKDNYYKYLYNLLILNPVFLFNYNEVLLYELFLKILQIDNADLIFNALILFTFNYFRNNDFVPIADNFGNITYQQKKKNNFYLLENEFINIIAYFLNNRNKLFKPIDSKNDKEKNIRNLINNLGYQKTYLIDDVLNYKNNILITNNKIIHLCTEATIVKKITNFLTTLCNKTPYDLINIANTSFLALKNYSDETINVLLNILYHNAVILYDNIYKQQEKIINYIIENDKEDCIYLICNKKYNFMDNPKIKYFDLTDFEKIQSISDKKIKLIFTESETINLNFLNYTFTILNDKIQKVIFLFDYGKEIGEFNEVFSILPCIRYKQDKDNIIETIKQANYDYDEKTNLYNFIMNISENKYFKHFLIKDTEIMLNDIQLVYIACFYKVFSDIFHHFFNISIEEKDFLNGYKGNIDFKNILLNFCYDYKIFTLFENNQEKENLINLSSSKFFNKMLILYLIGIRFCENTFYVSDKAEITIHGFYSPNNNLAKAINNYKRNQDIEQLKNFVFSSDFEDLILSENIPFIVKNNFFNNLKVEKNDILLFKKRNEIKNIKYLEFIEQQSKKLISIEQAHFNNSNFDYAFSCTLDKNKYKYNNAFLYLLGNVSNSPTPNYFSDFNLKKIYNLFDFFENLNKYKLVIYFGEQIMNNYNEINFNYEHNYNLINLI